MPNKEILVVLRKTDCHQPGPDEGSLTFVAEAVEGFVAG